MANPPVQSDLHAERLGALNEKRYVDKTDISRFATHDSALSSLTRRGGLLGLLIGTARMRHELVNHE